MKIQLEVHGDITSRVPRIRKILDIGGNHPGVRVCWNSNQTDLLDGGFDANFRLVRDQIGQVHMRDLFLEEYPWRQLLTALTDMRFDGYCFAEIPESADPLRVLKVLSWTLSGVPRPVVTRRRIAVINRRRFLTTTAAATAGLAAGLPTRGHAQGSANDTINVAVIGIRGDNKGHPTWTARGRGQDHYEHLSKIANVRISHVVDVDERHFASSLPFLKDTYGGDPRTETDFRRVLENRDVDAVTHRRSRSLARLMTILACQAGKDVYVEKPISHNIVEGRRMIEAARRYNRIVAVGTQRRSGAVVAKAEQFLREGGLGTIYAGRTVIYRLRDPIGVVADSQVPSA